MIDVTRTAEHWDKQHFEASFLRGEWSFHPAAKARLHDRILGGVSAREEWFWKRYLAGRSGLKALGIGVGRCESELRLLTTGTICHYDLFDLSTVALDYGRRDAERHGVEQLASFHAKDVRPVDLPDNYYDVITFIASLHHIVDLEGMLKKCERALAPGGVIWAAEYIGPDYFDYPRDHTELARRFYRIIDPDLKKAWEPELRFPTVQEVIDVDPTESVHSSKIPIIMKSIFPDLDVIPTYGTFAFILFWCLNHDALYDTDKGRQFARTVMHLDTALLDSGRLPHYFAYLIARKPK